MTTTAPLVAAPPRPAIFTLLPVLLAVLALPMSLTSVAVALPSIGASLHAQGATLEGAITGFNVAFASLMLAAGAAGDLLGRRRLFVAGAALFAAGQSAAVIVPDVWVLVAGRTVAGVGAALVLTTGSAMLANRFDGASRAKAFGAFGTTLGAGLSLGPLIGGVLADQLGWQAVLLLLALLGAAAGALGAFGLEESRDPEAQGVDWGGTITFTGALAALTLGIVGAPQAGWLSPRTGVLVALALLLGAAFVAVERRHRRPMLDLTLLRNPGFLGIGVAAMAVVLVFVPLLVNLPTLLADTRGVDATAAGALMLLLTVPTLAVPVVAGGLVQRLHVGLLVGTGLVLETAGVLLLAFVALDGSVALLAVPLLTVGFGVGIANGVLDGAAVSAVAPARAGMAAGLFNTMRLGAETTAIAVSTSALSSMVAAGRTPDAAFSLTAAGLAIVCGAALALAMRLVLQGHAREIADETAGDAATALVESEACPTSAV